MLDLLDDRVLVDDVSHRPAKLQIAKPVPLLLGQVCLAALGIGSLVLIEGQEGRAEVRTATMNGEVLLVLERFQVGELVTEDTMNVGQTVAEGLEFTIQIRHDDLHDAVEIRQAIAVGVGQPIVGIAAEHYAFTRHVLLDQERTGADDFRRIGVEIPGLG